MNEENTVYAQTSKTALAQATKAPSVLEELSMELESLECGIYDLHARLDRISNRPAPTPDRAGIEKEVNSSLHINALTSRVRLAGQIVHKMIDELVI